MRFLILIPVFVLFLSNMPFIHEMPMEVKSAMSAGEETCMMNMGENGERSCMPGKEPMNCGDPEESACSNRCETTTTCICVFTFSAPVQDIKAFQVHSFNTISGRTGYLQLKWK